MEEGVKQTLRKLIQRNVSVRTLRGVIPVVYIRLIGRELYSQ
jgi:hypothetical protein